ncbi:MAG: radical SAM protein, partial [Candidatus Thorarchaeota archaeon]
GCTFCSSSRVSGKRWRGRSAESIVEEIEYLMRTYGIYEIEFLDDLFSYDPKRVVTICNLLLSKNIKPSWTCSTRADILASNPEMAMWLKAAGCHTVYMGVESGSPRILKLMKKGITLDHVYRSMRAIKASGLGSILSFILGYPGETPSEMDATIQLAKKLDPEFAQFTICTPYPGTPLFETAKMNNWLQPNSWHDFSVLGTAMDIPDVSIEELKEFLYKAYLKFYLRPSFLWRQIRSKNLFLVSKVIQGIRRYIRQRKRNQNPTKERRLAYLLAIDVSFNQLDLSSVLLPDEILGLLKTIDMVDCNFEFHNITK